MKQEKTIKDCVDRLLSIVNKVRTFGIEFSNSRIVQKILATILESSRLQFHHLRM